MAKYRVWFKTGAAAYVDVDLTDVEIDPEVREDEEALREAIIEIAYDDLPDLCAHCSGMGYGSTGGIDLGDFEYDDSDGCGVEPRESED